MSRATPQARERFIATLLKHVPTATRDDALRILRWGATYGRLAELACSSEWACNTPEGQHYMARTEERAERIIRETCRRMWEVDRITVVPMFSGDLRGHTVKLRLADGYTDDWGQIGLCVPTS